MVSDQREHFDRPFARVHRESVGSTNEDALKAFANGERRSTWFTSDEQRAGKGRRGRHWVSPVGNFYGSLLLIQPSKADVLSQLTFVASLAVFDAIAEFLPESSISDLQLKWPNDVLFRGSKVAGILLESSITGSTTAVAIGCGINCRIYPEDTPYPVTSLQRVGHDVSPRQMFAALEPAFRKQLVEWQAGAGFESLRQTWINRSRGIGHPIVVRMNDRELHGIFQGLDSDGRLLLLQAEQGTSTISAGDIFPV